MEILLVEPYSAGSHAEWALGYARHSAHVVRTLSMSGAHWKWRMHGGAVTLARKFHESGHAPDLILATDMLDLAGFLALTRARTAGVAAAVYFHENQITYPWSPFDRDPAERRDEHYGFINFTSALAADRVFFNSQYHMDSFMDELPGFLSRFPDHQEISSVERIRDKASVLPLGFDFARLDPLTLRDPAEEKTAGGRRPLVLWNHRWEYDKNPDEFFRALRILASRGLDFDVALLGESFEEIPACFADAESELGDRIVQFGYVRERSEYARWLRRADLLPVTSNQEFFGASVVEAVFCGCFPILPARLAYPELFPVELRSACFYRDFDDLVRRLTAAITQVDRVRKISFRSVAEKFDWRRVAPVYDAVFADTAARSRH
jgi:glycosyltransferase involved in cell wall biosynthesis